MIEYGRYTLEEIFTHMAAGKRRAMLHDGEQVKLSSDRLVLFFTKGVECAECGLRANMFVRETHDQAVTPHLNLYYVDGDDKVLFTKDHIVPKALGGSNSLENYQTMCAPCNGKKGSRFVGTAREAQAQPGNSTGLRTSCVECGDGRGWRAEPDPGTGEPMQVECRACYEAALPA